MWRLANRADDPAIALLSHALYEEDPSPDPVPPENLERTLRALRDQPARGRAIVLELDGALRGYALVIAFWSNELGGELAVIDELYVAPAARGAGHASRFLQELARGEAPWAPPSVALSLEVTPKNERARRLYERLGFRAANLTLRRRL